MLKLCLASASPQRLLMLRQIGWEPELYPVDSAEALPDYDTSTEQRSHAEAGLRYVVVQIARAKLEAALAQYRPQGSAINELWLAADTMVATAQPSSTLLLQLQAAGARKWGRWLLLGKPENEEAAALFLRYLSATQQSVCSAISTWHNGKPNDYSEISKLQFRSLCAQELAEYLATGEWRGAAGAYRYQGRGAELVAWQSGSHSNIIGLPLEYCQDLLRSAAAWHIKNCATQDRCNTESAEARYS